MIKQKEANDDSKKVKKKTQRIKKTLNLKEEMKSDTNKKGEKKSF